MIWSLNNIIDHPWITDLKYAKESYEKKSKTDFYYGSSNPNFSDRLDLLSHNIAIYTKDTAVVTSINGNDISETYGKIEFEILWEHFPEEQRNDYSFIRDNFRDKFSFTKKDARPIITVQASEEYFIDFALRYIHRIRILDPDAEIKIKKQIAKLPEMQRLLLESCRPFLTMIFLSLPELF